MQLSTVWPGASDGRPAQFLCEVRPARTGSGSPAGRFASLAIT
jgi:hypothetical protein